LFVRSIKALDIIFSTFCTERAFWIRERIIISAVMAISKFEADILSAVFV
jgi:hypothetical protein